MDATPLLKRSALAPDVVGPAAAATQSSAPARPASGIRRRRVHFFSGFDPRGAAHYHRLCREEAARPQPHGGTLAVGARERLDGLMSRWEVTWVADGPAPADAAPAAPRQHGVHTEHVFMAWNDLVRAHWPRGALALLVESVRAYGYLFRHIGAARVARMYRPAFHAGLLPLLVFPGPLLLAGWLAALLGLPGAVGGLAIAVAAWAVGIRAGLPWLLRIFAFFRHMGGGPIAGLDARTREWVEAIVTRQQADPADEVLLVGHSVGALVMVDTVDALLRDARWKALQQGRPTALLTLGQSYPMVALAPGAKAFRHTLQRLSRHARLLWWDVTARIDPLCFHALHPLVGTGLPHHDAPWPVRHAARFMAMYEPARWARIRTDKLRAHFLYLMTPQRPGNFSPADVLYGPRSLAQQMQDGGAVPHGQ